MQSGRRDFLKEYLKTLRKESGKTQLEIAKKLDVSESYYSLIETGERQADMSLSVMKKLSEAFDVPLEFIIDEEMKLRG